MLKMLKAAANVALLFQRNRFLDVTDDDVERPWDHQAYVTCDLTNIVALKPHTVTGVLIIFSLPG